MRWALMLLMAVLVTAGSTISASAAKVAASRRAAATVIGFTGFVAANDSYHGSSVVSVIESLRQRGLAAEVRVPNDASNVADELITRPPAGPIILFGYSKGTDAAIAVAERLGAAGMRVRAVVLLEGWNLTPIPANVERAVHYYITNNNSGLDKVLRGELFRPSAPHQPIQAGLGFAGSLQNVDLRTRIPRIENENHVTMSKLAAVQTIVISEIIRNASRAATRIRSARARQ